MRLSEKTSGNHSRFYVIRSVMRNGKRSSEVVEKLGSEEEIKEKYGCTDARAWAKKYVEELNNKNENGTHKVLIPMYTDVRIESEHQSSFNIGYLFLQKIYHQLGIPYICKKISERHNFEYDLDSILSRLIYGRILFPSSKLSCWQQSKDLYEQPNFELHQIYRALSVLADESDLIQERLYKNSKKVIGRSTGVLYYDCTNYFFEIEQEDDLRKYGQEKNHRPNPIVQMGMFIDRSGIPLAFSINPGNTNEQITLRPLEQRIMRDFELSKFVVCTDGGLSSEPNRKFNNLGERSFITTHSLKTKISNELREWALSPEGWHLKGSHEVFDLRNIGDSEDDYEFIYYKQRYIEGYDEERNVEFNQTFIVTYSKKYADYQRKLRDQQVDRALKLAKDPSKVDRNGANDVRRFIKKTKVTKDGEIADIRAYELDQHAIDEEAKYDGFYAVYTNLDDDPEDIVQINRGRWEIEESFRILKHEFEARPVYVQRDERIMAHFLTCFMSLLIYRILEKQLSEKYTCDKLLSTLRVMRMTEIAGMGFVPSYTRTELTDALHENAGFHTDFQFITNKSMKGICRRSKCL